uniref:Uncharacterized protein n=1 Tax=Ditylenchus dipsaci TaxID=166011 RepID=A0A915D9W0_9BILA
MRRIFLHQFAQKARNSVDQLIQEVNWLATANPIFFGSQPELFKQINESLPVADYISELTSIDHLSCSERLIKAKVCFFSLHEEDKVDLGKALDGGSFDRSMTILNQAFSFDIHNCVKQKSGLHVCNSLKPKFCSLNSLWQCSKEYKNEPITRIIPFSNGFQVATNQHKVMIHSNSSITNETVIVPSTGIFLSPEANSTYVLGNLTLRPTLLPLINLKAEHYENPKILAEHSFYEQLADLEGNPIYDHEPTKSTIDIQNQTKTQSTFNLTLFNITLSWNGY